MMPHRRSVERGDESPREVTAATDEIGGRRHLVIADLTRDEAWLSMPESEASMLAEWR
ncbi:DUF7556 family protein [Natrarchaeobius oligotrophus]|uniref:DUF7556 family protein n=1 Tax=Natrarchaeobius oligotrophus TaxID=3455743 RepID=UPI0014051C15|nr:hypothetical protein [Natrarchaeobius chitinivorans]